MIARARGDLRLLGANFSGISCDLMQFQVHVETQKKTCFLTKSARTHLLRSIMKLHYAVTIRNISEFVCKKSASTIC